MKLLFYTSCIGGGGAARVMTTLANQYAKLKHTVYFATNFAMEREYELDSRIVRMNLDPTTLDRSVIRRNIGRIRALRKQIVALNPDIVISFMAENNFRAVIANLFRRNKLILSVRSDPRKEYRGQVRAILAKIMFRFTDGIVLQTIDAMKYFPKSIQKNARIIPNMVNPGFMDIQYEGVRKGIVTAGRMTSVKNHKMLIKAFYQIKDVCEDNLTIYGEGIKAESIKDELKELTRQLGIEERVIFAGEVSNLESVMASAKIFVLTSNYEGMPNALMEAMALGLPCISTDCPCGGPNMLLDQGRSGILIPVGDVDRLAVEMRTLLSNPAIRDDYAAKARRRAMDHFHPNKVFDQWDALIKFTVGV